MPKLLVSEHARSAQQVTNHLSDPFELCYKYRLERHYTFTDMNPSHYKEWQGFLDKVSVMTFEDVEKSCRCKSDKSDVYNGEQVIHLRVGKRFRVHGVIENGRFVVLRMDPNHRVHKG